MNIRVFKILEWTVGILLTAAAIGLFASRARHAGGLWRDECACVQLANMPTLSGVFQNFQRESFPVTFPLTVRLYSALFGTTDTAYRLFGFAVGLSLLGVLWANALLVNREPPLLAVVLLAFNTTFLVWGTTIRGYGLGTVFIVFAFGMIAQMLRAPTRRSVLLAALASLGSVQFLFYNSVLLAAFAFAVFAVCFAQRRFGPAKAIAIIGIIAAVSVLPYLGPFWHEHFFTIVFQRDLSLSWIWSKLEPALGRPPHIMPIVWAVLILSSIAGSTIRLRKLRSQPETNRDDMSTFALIAMIAAIIAYSCFIIAVAYGTQEWYYLALLAAIAAAVDLIFAVLASNQWIRAGRLLFCTASLFAMPFFDWSAVVQRQTNLDLVARKMEEIADAQDLVVVNPWFFGVGFNWYYHGKTPWETVPPMGDHNFHRFDLLKERMASADAIVDLTDRIMETLRLGHRVWFVGGIKLLDPGQLPGTLPPAPQSKYGWNCDIYDELWSRQLGAFMQQHALDLYVDVAEENKFNPLEDVGVVIAEGWDDDPGFVVPTPEPKPPSPSQ